MRRRDTLQVLGALLAAGATGSGQKPAPNIESPKQRQMYDLDVKVPSSVKRPWVISNRMVKILALEPAAVSRYFALTVLGEDGKRYPIDDVLYGLLTVIEHHLFPESAFK